MAKTRLSPEILPELVAKMGLSALTSGDFPELGAVLRWGLVLSLKLTLVREDKAALATTSGGR